MFTTPTCAVPVPVFKPVFLVVTDPPKLRFDHGRPVFTRPHFVFGRLDK